MRQEKIHEVTILITPGVMVGQVYLVGNSPFIVVGIRDTLGELGVTRLQLVEPSWPWKVKYHLKRFFRRVWQILQTPYRWARSRASSG